MIELDVVDLIGGLCLEPLVDQLELVLAHVQLHRVEDRAESSGRHEATVAPVLVLKEGLHEQAFVPHLSADAKEGIVKNSLFGIVENVLGVQDGGGSELLALLQRVLLQVFLCENALHILVESDIVDLGGISSRRKRPL